MMRRVTAGVLSLAADGLTLTAWAIDTATGAGVRAAHRLDLAAWRLGTWARAIREGRS